MLEQEVAKFEKWLNQRKAAPAIAKVRNYADEVVKYQLDKLFSQMPYLNEKERERIELAMKSVINKVLHRPTMYIKEKASSEEGDIYIKMFEEMFSRKWDYRKIKEESKRKKS